MSNTLPIQEWLRTIDDEYLSSGFIKDGGAAVKFTVTRDALKPVLHEALQRRCREFDFVLATLDAAAMRAHMPQDIFFGLARQIDWRLLARRLILRLAVRKSYDVRDMDGSASDNVFAAIADANQVDKRLVIQDLRPLIQDEVFRNPKMAKDFRVAMSHLCLREDIGDAGEYDAHAILDWLKGDNTRVSSVRPFSIYSGITRTTARYFIQSTLHWIQFAGCAGIVILLDNSRVTVARNPKDGRRYYTRAMTMEHYELLRELVDDVDRLPGLFLVVVANEEFLDTDKKFRGYGIYEALQTRIMDDVRDRNLVNPVASVVQFSGEE